MRRDAERILDEYLAASARAGDRGALERLAVRFEARLTAHARRLTHDRDMGREAAQDAWIEIVRGLPKLDDVAAFPAWAFKIVTRCCGKAIRHKQRERRVQQAAAAHAAVDSGVAMDAMRAVDGRAASTALDALPAEQRAAAALFYIEELSVAEVAVALDVPTGTVKTRLMHARRKLRALLEGDDNA